MKNQNNKLSIKSKFPYFPFNIQVHSTWKKAHSINYFDFNEERNNTHSIENKNNHSQDLYNKDCHTDKNFVHSKFLLPVAICFGQKYLIMNTSVMCYINKGKLHS